MKNRLAFTISEVLIAAFIMAMLFVGTIGVYMFIERAFGTKTAELALQQDVNNIVSKIIRGYKEGGNIVGLRSAASFTLPVVTPAGNRIQYVGSDGWTRSYFLSGNTIQYTSPTQWPNQNTVYTARSGSSITLRFWEPSGSGDHETIGIYLGILRSSGGRVISGSASTYINIRNLQK